MSAQFRQRQFTSIQDAMRRRKPVWFCFRCNIDTQGSKGCSKCGGGADHFPSTGEFTAYMHRRMRERAGEITDLRAHPAFPLVINGIRVGRYHADWMFRENGRLVIEEFKGSKAHQTRDSSLRRKVAQALYGVEIQVVEN